MLTDIFADRYISIPMWEKFGEVEQRFLVQGFRIVIEQLYPYWVGGKESTNAKIKLTAIHDKLSMELGLSELAPKYYVSATSASTKPMSQVCKDFVCAKFEGSASADRFMKERISFIELAFREREEELSEINLKLPKQLAAATLQDKPQTIRGFRIPISEGSIKGLQHTLSKC